MSHRGILLVALFAIGSASTVQAQTVTAFKTGEAVTGMTKQCYYAFGSTRYTTTIRSVELCALSIQVRTPPAPATQPVWPGRDTNQTSTVTAFKAGEETTGMTKQCY